MNDETDLVTTEDKTPTTPEALAAARQLEQNLAAAKTAEDLAAKEAEDKRLAGVEAAAAEADRKERTQGKQAQLDEEAAKAAESAPAKLLGFIAVSATAAVGVVNFPVVDGFTHEQPMNDLQAKLATDGDWSGYAVVIDPEIGLVLQPVPGSTAQAA